MKPTLLIILPLFFILSVSEKFVIAQTQPANTPDYQWLKKYIHPLKTYNPEDEDLSDLDILGQIAGDKKIIALGEVTHGSREIFKLKHRIIKYLCIQHGFDLLSWEACMPEAFKLNDYIIEGKGNPVELIRGLHFWTVQTQEILDLVKWMRWQKLNGPAIRFSGFDMQYYSGAIEELKQSFTDDSETLHLIGRLSGLLDSLNAKSGMPVIGKVSEPGKRMIGQQILEIRKHIETAKFPNTQKTWLFQNLRIIGQSVANTPWDREIFMAENFDWIKTQNPDSKIVVWGHNMHVMRTGHDQTLLPMGGYLSNTYKDEYLNIGFAFYEGTYTALSRGVIGTHPAEKAYDGTYEYIFNQFDEPIFLLDLKKIKDDQSAQARAFIKNTLKFRLSGAIWTGKEFDPKNIADDFDCIIFIKTSSNSIILK
jgi:erythromycin esterase